MIETTAAPDHIVKYASARRRRGACAGGGLLVALLLVMASLASGAQAASALGRADSFAVLAGSAVTNTGPSVIGGDVGVSPKSSVTGFGLGLGTVLAPGTVHRADRMTSDAQADLAIAYDSAAGRTSTAAITGDLAGRTLVPGVYTSASSVGLNGVLTLDAGGDPDAVFVLQAGSALLVGTSAVSGVRLIGGAQACHVFWQVASSATIGAGSTFSGNILAHTSISLKTAATLNGRALAQHGAVTLDTNTITKPACVTTAISPRPQFGAWSPNDPYYDHPNSNNRQPSIAQIEKLQKDTGRPVEIVNWFQQWGRGRGYRDVEQPFFQAVVGTTPTRTPMLTWEPWSVAKHAGGRNQSRYRLRNIRRGNFDRYIKRFARNLRDLKVNVPGGQITPTVYLRPMHEMNGNQYPWAVTVNHNTARQFQLAWRHIHYIFETTGAKNVKFVFSPLVDDAPRTPTMKKYYPGSRYVDVLALDGYNNGKNAKRQRGWRTFSKLFGTERHGPYHRLAALNAHKPIWIAEVGAAPDAPTGTSKALWVRDMWRKAAKMSRLRAIVWFNENKKHEHDWRANPPKDPTVARAFGPPF